MEVGKDLNIESLQDKETYDEKNSNSGFNFSVDVSQPKGKPATYENGGITGGTNKGKTNSTYESVTDQAGIYAGKGGFDIEVGKNTDLKGAVIASEADASKNKLSTDTLTYSDIENKAEYEASSSGVAYDSRKYDKDDPNYKNQGATPVVGTSSNGEADSTTKAAIADGTIEIRSNPQQNIANLSRDTENALNALDKIFDKKTVQEQQELAQLFGQVAFKAIGDLGLKEGSPEKAALDIVFGGIMTKVGGGKFAEGAASAGLTQLVMNELKNIKDPALLQWATAIVGAAAAKVVGGKAQTGASVAVSEVRNNLLTHQQQEEKLKELKNAQTKEEKEAINKKWDTISDEQEGNPEIEVVGKDLYGKDNETVYFLEAVEIRDYSERIEQWWENSEVYKIYKNYLIPSGQGFSAALLENISMGVFPIDMNTGVNSKMYYIGRFLGDGTCVIGGGITTLGGAGGTLASSPTGIGAVIIGTETATAGSFTIYSIKNLFNDSDRIFSSNGVSEEGSSKAKFETNPFNEVGNLKPNIKYKAGEYNYSYESDGMGRISKFETDNLKLTNREGRLDHNPNTPGKLDGDHAGHLAGDRFGGSPELDNLVSQSSNVNLSQYKKIENEWAKAIQDGKQVKVNVDIKYEGNSLRPSEFNVQYEIDGKYFEKSILN